jgi:hypothetical protein
MRSFALLMFWAFSLPSFAAPPAEGKPVSSAYFDSAGRDDVLSGGVKMVTIHTARGTFRVWTKRVGNNPTIKVLLLHGGPGATHEYLEAFDSYFPEGRHRVLLLRSAGLRLQRSAGYTAALGNTAVRRGGRAGPSGAASRQN